jgi:hypothetical protein
MLEDGNLQIKSVIEMSSPKSSLESSPPPESSLEEELPQSEKRTHSYLQKPVGVPSPLNSTKIIEASDFTKEQVNMWHSLMISK